MTELKETIDLMVDKDYKKRFEAEYWQTKIRYEKLKNFCDKIEAKEVYGAELDVNVNHDCPYELLRMQQRKMGDLLHILELRAIIEGINLEQEIVSNDMCDSWRSGKCLGTPEIDPCSCGGNKQKCDFYSP